MIWSNFKVSAFDWLFFFFNCMCIQFSEMEACLLSSVIQNWYFIYSYNFLQIYAQVCSTWNLQLFATFTLLRCSTVTLNIDVVSLDSCKNKENLLIRQIFNQTLPIFWFSNVWLQHKNGRTCSMTNRYLHQWKSQTVIYINEKATCIAKIKNF